MKRGNILLSLIIGLVVLVGGLAFVLNVQADDKVDVCHYDGQSGNFQTLNIAQEAADEHLEQHELDYAGPCEEASPEVSPSPEASPEASPSPSPSPEPEDFCDTLEGVQAEDEDCPKDEPSPTPEASPTPTVENRLSEAKAPQCPDGNVAKVAANVQVARTGDHAVVSWFRTEGDNATIYFKEVNASGWQHSVYDIKTTGFKDDYVSYTINNLDPALGYTFGVAQQNGCGGEATTTAVVIDGPATQVFYLSYFE